MPTSRYLSGHRSTSQAALSAKMAYLSADFWSYHPGKSRCRNSVVAANPASLGGSLPLIELPTTASLPNLQLVLRLQIICKKAVDEIRERAAHEQKISQPRNRPYDLKRCVVDHQSRCA